MSYSDFTLKQVQHDFDLKIIEKKGIFSTLDAVKISNYLVVTLEENIPLAIAINTEKAKSELIISAILVEVRKIFKREISFFSGIEFNIDKEQGLNGYCDFLISLSPEQLFIKSPVIALVEAKNENIIGGLGQCIAEMIAARMFNEAEGNNIAAIYGTVTTGLIWKFIKLTDNTVQIDLKDYSLDEKPEQIIGILSSMMAQKA
jgi:hypothetical protein